MRAVNLLPADMRGAAQKPASPKRDAEPAQGIGAYLVLGVLALAVAAFAGYVLTTNTVKQRQADLEAAQQRTAAATAKANALQPYADFETLANARVETVRGLAAARFDWERAISDVSLATPRDVKLQSLNGDMGLPGASSASGGDPLRSSIAAPAITMVGCAPSQTDVAQMMSRLRTVQGVTRVALSKSEKPALAATAGSAVSACGKGTPPSFSVVVFFERSAALAALAPAEASAAQTVPVPNAIDQAPAAENGATGEAAPADGEADAGATASTDPASTTTTTTTSTSTGSTP
jgi:hypothetical protein